MKRTEPSILIDDAKQAFPNATNITLSCRAETTFDWLRVVRTGAEFNGYDFEAGAELTVQEGAKVVFTCKRQTLTEIAKALTEGN